MIVENSGIFFWVSKLNIQYKPNGIKLKELPIQFLFVYDIINVERNLNSSVLNSNEVGNISLNQMKIVDDISFEPDTTQIYIWDSI